MSVEPTTSASDQTQTSRRGFYSKLGKYSRRAIGWSCIYYCVSKYLFEVVQSDGPSMLPNLRSGDLLLSEHLSVRLHCIHKGDLVAFRSPTNPRVLMCKRVQAMEGERIPYPKLHDKCPPEHLWVAGDNRANSQDSHMFGPIPYGLLYARVVFRIWPLSRFGSLSSHWFYEPPPP